LVTVVDAAKFPKLVSMLGDFYVDQIENADIVLVNKIDLVDSEQLSSIAGQLREINPDAEILFSEQGKVVPERLFQPRDHGLLERALEEFGYGQREEDDDHHDDDDHDHGHDHDHHHSHEKAPDSFVVNASGRETRRGIEQFFSGLPDNVWRAKGFLEVDGMPSLVQYSIGQLEITPAQPHATPAVVFIGQGMDRSRIEADFALVTTK